MEQNRMYQIITMKNQRGMIRFKKQLTKINQIKEMDAPNVERKDM